MAKDLYVKKYWDEEDVLFYLHFKDGFAIRQVEITEGKKILLSDENPVDGEHFLCDQTLEGLDLEDEDFISSAAFEKVWEED
ncbi:MAG: hypothetical protein V4581_09280 [Bacteroidota bacterium]